MAPRASSPVPASRLPPPRVAAFAGSSSRPSRGLAGAPPLPESCPIAPRLRSHPRSPLPELLQRDPPSVGLPCAAARGPVPRSLLPRLRRFASPCRSRRGMELLRRHCYCLASPTSTPAVAFCLLLPCAVAVPCCWLLLRWRCCLLYLHRARLAVGAVAAAAVLLLLSLLHAVASGCRLVALLAAAAYCCSCHIGLVACPACRVVCLCCRLRCRVHHPRRHGFDKTEYHDVLDDPRNKFDYRR
ncbi:hypothetical protein ZWY2020_019998 [Hordeum vulgare]|nr:hypothetical protein ZWY2020_019998 [Hordeum vulgare]